MLILLTSSKRMDMTPVQAPTFTRPIFPEQSRELVEIVRGLSVPDVMALMGIREPLAVETQRRFRDWAPPFTRDNAKQALFAFTGDVFDGLDAPTLGKRDLAHAQKHLRLLSGLYGVLRPLDLIQAYRLEMGYALRTPVAGNLVGFWREAVTGELARHPGGLVINLASREYLKSVDGKVLGKEIVSPAFQEENGGRFRTVGIYSKRARGAMARYLIQNRVDTVGKMLEFSREGYSYNPDLSTRAKPVFTR